MRAYVFTDKALTRYAGQFVWLSVNTEDSRNAGFLAKYPISSLPTLLVLNEAGDRIITRYIGGATVPQLAKLLDASSAGRPSGFDALARSADQAASAGKHAEAANLYKSVLEKAPKGWPRFGPIAESLVYSLYMAKEYERCATEAIALTMPLRSTRSGANVATSGLDCALSLDENNARRIELTGALEKTARESLGDPALDLAADDRSGIYMSIISARKAMHDQDGTLKLLREWASFLEKAAREAKTPEQRTVYDAHRLTAYLDLGTPGKAIPMLEQSERDFPSDYNPPARLIIAYKAMGEYDMALAASKRAFALAYGPRKLTIYRNVAAIHVARGDTESARKTFIDAIEHAKQLPRAQLSANSIASLEAELAKLPAK